MPSVNRIPTVSQVVDRQRNRLEDLERRTKPQDRPSHEEIATFSHSGTVAVSTSTPYYVRKGGQIVSLDIAVGTQASTSSTFRLRVNGSVVGNTVTFPASTSSTSLYVGNVRVAPGSRLHLEAVTVGTGLADLGANVVMKG